MYVLQKVSESVNVNLGTMCVCSTMFFLSLTDYQKLMQQTFLKQSHSAILYIILVGNFYAMKRLHVTLQE